MRNQALQYDAQIVGEQRRYQTGHNGGSRRGVGRSSGIHSPEEIAASWEVLVDDVVVRAS